MTRDDIIRMAREAGICIANSILLPAPKGQVEALERFADLISAAEREACAKVCEDLWKFNAPATECADAIRARSNT